MTQRVQSDLHNEPHTPVGYNLVGVRSVRQPTQQ